MSDDNNVSVKKQDIHDDNQHVPQIRFPEFDDKYRILKLKDISNFSKGKNISKKDISNNGIPCIRYGELYTKYNEIIDDVYSKTNLNKNDLIFSKENDIIIPSSGETAIDISTASCILKDNIAISADTTILRTKENGPYLAYYLNYKKYDIAKLAQGASVVHLYSNELKKLKIIIPSIKEQEKIAYFIYLVDKKIELLEKKLVLWDKHLTYWINELTTENDKYNFSWKNYKLKDFLEEYKEKSQINNQYPLLSSTKEKIVLQEKYFNKRIASKNDKGYKILHKNQLVLSPQNLWLGNININDEFKVGIVSPSYIIYNLNNKIINKNYLKFIIKKPKMLYLYETVSEQGASIVRRNLNKNLFINLKIKLPSITEQEIIGYFLLNLYNKNKMLENKINTIKLFKKGLLQKMFI